MSFNNNTDDHPNVGTTLNSNAPEFIPLNNATLPSSNASNSNKENQSRRNTGAVKKRFHGRNNKKDFPTNDFNENRRDQNDSRDRRFYENDSRRYYNNNNQTNYNQNQRNEESGSYRNQESGSYRNEEPMRKEEPIEKVRRNERPQREYQPQRSSGYYAESGDNIIMIQWSLF